MGFIAAWFQKINLVFKWALIMLIRSYRLAISPLLGNCCRFTPSCSTYAQEAITIHGCFKGSWLALRRVLRCHPWSPGGKDEVNPKNR